MMALFAIPMAAIWLIYVYPKQCERRYDAWINKLDKETFS